MKTNESKAGHLVAACATLLLLLGAALALTALPPGGYKAFLTAALAIAKVVIIMIFFMRLGSADGRIRTAALAGYVWLALLILLALADYLTR